jgi:hypothetical protein
MSMTNYLENALLELLLNGEPITGLADDAATSPLTELYLSLHTSDPGEGGDQTTNEIAYTGYERVAVSRTTAGWTVVGNVANLTANVEFPLGTGGSGTATYVGVGTAATGAGTLLLKGALDPVIVCGAGYIPRLTTASTITFD